MFCYLLCLHIFMRIDQESLKQLALFGASLGVLVLARIDAAVFVAILAAAVFLILPGSLMQRIRRFLAVSLPAFIVSLPWWAYNLIAFHDLVPSSGRALQSFDPGFARIKHALHAILQALAPQIYLEGESRLISAIRLIFLIALAFGLIAIKPPEGVSAARIPSKTRKAIIFLVSLLATYAILILYYTLDSWAWFFYFRYFIPLALFDLSVLAVVICYFLDRANPIARRAALLIIPLPTVLLIIFGGHYSKVWSPSPFLGEQIPLVSRHVQSDAWVGALQSGTLGFFRDRVINLDGRVNAEVLPERHDLSAYLDKKGIKWLADWDWLMDSYLQEPGGRRWKKVARSGSMFLYKREDE
jgi:hypothetical protein